MGFWGLGLVFLPSSVVAEIHDSQPVLASSPIASDSINRGIHQEAQFLEQPIANSGEVLEPIQCRDTP